MSVEGWHRMALPMFEPPENLERRLVVHMLTNEPSSGGVGVSVWCCNACGSLVFDLQAHARWHQDMPDDDEVGAA